MVSSSNRPTWRQPLVKGNNQQARFPGYQSRYGDGHPNRRQCVAAARTTGQRCRKDALQGAACCQVHGGHRQAYRNASAGFSVANKGHRVTRKGLATLATVERYPVGEPYLASPVDRGLVIETVRNRQLGLTKGDVGQ